MLARIGARIVAENQRRTLLKLLNEGLPFFGKRHSSEFLARLSAGANSASVVVNLLVSAAGRDLLTVVGTCIVMLVGDPLLLLMFLVVIAPS
jgi:ATP-binding cassette subfamily B protein